MSAERKRPDQVQRQKEAQDRQSEDRNGDISGGTAEMVKSSGFEVRKTTIALLITGI